jgi:hypothetical protein
MHPPLTGLNDGLIQQRYPDLSVTVGRGGALWGMGILGTGGADVKNMSVLVSLFCQQLKKSSPPSAILRSGDQGRQVSADQHPCQGAT